MDQPNGTPKDDAQPSTQPAPTSQPTATSQSQPTQTSQASQSQQAKQQQQQQSQPQHKPRDVRLLHSLLAAQGVSAYQERVPLMLLDFAYRYTRSVLSDAQQLSWEGYGGTGTNQNSGRAADAPTDVSLQSLRLAAQGRQIVLGSGSGIGGVGSQKADLLELSAETNRVGLPRVEREFGVRLPGERYLLTGGGFGLKEEWVEIDEDEATGAMQVEEGEDVLMLEGGDEKDEDGDEAMFGSEDGDDADFEEAMGIKQEEDRKMVDV